MKKFMKRVIPLLLVVSLIVALGCTAFATEPEIDVECTKESCTLPFEDVSVDSWYHSYVHFVYEHDLMVGTAETIFAPDETMNRAMLVTVLYRLTEPYFDEEVPASAFVDVPADTWYTEAVDWAAYHGVVFGVDEEHFDPMGPVTREQTAAILFRFANVFELDDGLRADLSEFPDVGNIQPYAVEAFEWAVINELIFGSLEDDTVVLDPQGSATRAQVATLIARYAVYLGSNFVKS